MSTNDASLNILLGGSGFTGLALDTVNNYLFFSTPSVVSRMDAITGANIVNNVITGLSGSYNLEYYDGYLYISNYNNNTIARALITTSTTLTATTFVTGLSGPCQITFNPSNGTMYVANYDNSTISIVNTSGSIIGTITSDNPSLRPFSSPNGIVFSNNFLWLSCDSSSRFYKIDLASPTYASVLMSIGRNGGAGLSVDNNGLIYRCQFTHGEIFRTTQSETSQLLYVIQGNTPNQCKFSVNRGLYVACGSFIGYINNLNPTMSSFTIPSQTDQSPTFTITPPQTLSNGTITYTSSDTNVAQIVNTNQIDVTSSFFGSAQITASQSATNAYRNASISTTITVYNSFWTSRNAASNAAWSNVTFASTTGTFVAVANASNSVMTSTSGISWNMSSTLLPFIANWTSIATNGDNMYLVVSNNSNAILRSTDGTTSWSQQTTPSGIDGSFNNVEFMEGRFVIVGQNTIVYSNLTSFDTYTVATSVPSNNWTSVASSGSSLMIAVANTGTNNRILRSTTGGISWTTINSSGLDFAWNSIAFGNGTFVAVGNNCCMYSTNNGTTWTLTSPAPGTSNNWTSVAYGNGLFVAVSNNGTSDRSMTSPNGIDWTVSYTYNNQTNDNLSIVFGNGLFVAVAPTGSGVMTGVDNSCFLKGSRIRMSDNVTEKPIELLVAGDKVITYKTGIKTVLDVKRKLFSNSVTNPLMRLYRHKITGLIVSGGHSVLVDVIPEDAKMRQEKIGFSKNIEDKYMLLVCFSNDFDAIDIDNMCYEIYHLCLEDDDQNRHFGVWANDVLTETTTICHFNSHF